VGTRLGKKTTGKGRRRQLIHLPKDKCNFKRGLRITRRYKKLQRKSSSRNEAGCRGKNKEEKGKDQIDAK
jgi:hypothetical protein